MSQENKKRVEEILYAVRDGLGPYVLDRYKKEYTRKKYLEEIREVLDLDFDLPDEATALNRFDVEDWLKAMIYRWNNVFPNKPDKADYRNYFYGLRSARNKWAHPRQLGGPFTDDQVRHVASTAILLLKGTNAEGRKQIPIIQKIADDLSSQHSSKSEQKAAEKSARANNNHRSFTDSRLDVEVLQVKIEDKEAQMQTPESKPKQSDDSSSNSRTMPDKQTDEEKVENLERTSHADDAIQQLIRQHSEMMRHMQRQQASHLKTTASASADVIQLLFRQNQEFMQHMQQMQASQPAAPANADVIQQLIPLIHQNQALMQQASQSPASASDDAVQQLIRQNQAFMQHMQLQMQMQTSQPIININPNISPNINPSISANAGDQVTYAPSAPTTVIAERNNAAFVVGVLGGLFGLLGIAHIFNHKAGRGLVYLFIGTVCYWIFLLLLLSALVNIGSSLWIAAVAIHLAIIWQHAKRGASSASANQAEKP